MPPLSPDGERLALTGPAGYGLCDTTTAECPAVETAAGERRALGRRRAGRTPWHPGGRSATGHRPEGRALWTRPGPSTATDLRGCDPADAWPWPRTRGATATSGTGRAGRAIRVSRLAPGAGDPSSGRWITAGNQDASIHIWRTRDSEELTMSGYPDKVARLAFDDTGRWLAGDGAPDISVWDFAGKGPKAPAREPCDARDHHGPGLATRRRRDPGQRRRRRHGRTVGTDLRPDRPLTAAGADLDLERPERPRSPGSRRPGWPAPTAPARSPASRSDTAGGRAGSLPSKSADLVLVR